MMSEYIENYVFFYVLCEKGHFEALSSPTQSGQLPCLNCEYLRKKDCVIKSGSIQRSWDMTPEGNRILILAKERVKK